MLVCMNIGSRPSAHLPLQVFLQNEGTHLKSIMKAFAAYDSRVTEKYPLRYYGENHFLAGLLNCSDTAQTANCEFVYYEECTARPDFPTRRTRIFVKAKGPIPAGHELTAWYGEQYWA